MATPLPTSEQVLSHTVELRATGPEGFESMHTLAEGDALVVGCSPACGVRLNGWGVAGMHCTISLEDGRLIIDDWDTNVGTYVEGTRIARQRIVAVGAELTISQFRIATSLPAKTSPHTQPQEASKASRMNVKPAEVKCSLGDSGLLADSLIQDLTDSIWESPQQEAETDPASIFDMEPQYERIGVDDDTIELLKAECGYLRTELSERDVRLAELEQSLDVAGGRPDDDLPSREEVEALVGRLENLLAELEQSDARMHEMSELLRISEEANRAAEEERTQMESWLGEVERRVRQWEEEWEAERDSMKKRIAELTAERDQAESKGADRGSADVIRTLRQEASRMQTQVANLESERDDLQARLNASDTQSIEERVAKAVDAAMREERLQISQAKAEFARERAKLMQQQQEMASRHESYSVGADEADIRIRAFREHLKEIRATEPEIHQPPTLSQRLGKLWRKIDGRPLDTD